ncbi:MAG: hypothetical protein NC037_00055 [Bacteroides sp.]|nr:hypothetical protein [Bacillota bacterium]MCM1393358.1 hypothetical protein [[Eubacterium] siraeum]MCM1454912.1 hypothetical protein [Bacteroides sp.]
MKFTLKKFISALLAALLIVSTACLFFACNNGKDDAQKDAKLRAENVAVLKDEILAAMDEDWAGELENVQIASLENAGDYIVAAGWADVICEVLKNSALQTGKLTSLKNSVLSEDGQKLLADFEGNAELLIPLMRVAGFTPTDISNLTYDLLCALVSQSGSAVDAMQTRLDEIKVQPQLTAAASLNIDECRRNLVTVKRDLVPSLQEKTQMLNAFAAAKAPLSQIIEFAYNMSIDSVSDNIFNALFSSDGALSDISDEEIRTVVSSLVRSTASLKAALDDAALENLNRAVGLIIDKFDSASSPSSLFTQIVEYAKNIYPFMDAIPALCDVLGSVGNAFDAELIARFKSVAQEETNDNASIVNNAIIAANIALQIREDFTAQQLFDIIDNIAEKATDDYKKALPIFIIDISFNLSTWLEYGDTDIEITGKHDGIMSVDDVNVMVGTVLFTFLWENAKQVYSEYLLGKRPAGDVTQAVGACSFGTFGVTNEYDRWDGTNINARWFNYYANQGVQAVNEKAMSVCQTVAEDIKQFVTDFYAQTSPSGALTDEISKWGFVSGTLSEDDYKRIYSDKIFASDLVGLIGLISSIFD